MTSSLITVRPGPYLLAIKTGRGHLYAFDARGRLLHAYGDGVAFRRSPDHEVLEKRMLPGPRQCVEICCQLDAAEQMELQAAMRNALTAARAVVMAEPAAAGVRVEETARALNWIEAALDWDFKALAADGRRFWQLYRHPIEPLPPDRHQTLVLQVTDGQAVASDNLPVLRGLSDFAAHARAVRAFFGPDPLRRELFLASANALLHPLGRLRAYLDYVRGLFPEALRDAQGGFSTYVDAVAATKAHPRHWSELAGLGLRRVYVGLDKNDNWGDVFPNPEYAQPLVETLHDAGVAVGVMVTNGTATDDACSDLIRTLGLRGRDAVFVPRYAVPFGQLFGARRSGAGQREAPAVPVPSATRVVLYAPRRYGPSYGPSVAGPAEGVARSPESAGPG